MDTAVLPYTYDTTILTSNAEATVRHMYEVKNAVLEDIKMLKKEGCISFDIYANSIGSVVGFLVVNESKDISTFIINTAGADLAEIVWSWDTFKRFIKQGFIKKHCTVEQLQSQWKSISPIYNIKNITVKKVLFYTSTNDNVIPYEQSEKLIKALQREFGNIEVRYSGFWDHLLFATYNLLNFPIYLQFLKQ